MAWAFVQEAHRTSGNGSSVAGIQFSSVTVAGNAIIALASWANATAGSTYVNSQGNTMTVRKEVNDATNGASLSVATVFNITGGALSSVTASFSPTGSSAFSVIGITEYSGLSGFDIAVGQAATGSTAANNITSTQATPTGSSGALLFGAMVCTNGASTNTITAGTGYTARANTVYANNASAIVYEDQKQASTGSTSARFTQKQAQTYIAIMVAADISVGGGGGVSNPWTMQLMGMG
jgi:hypothetical protein